MIICPAGMKGVVRDGYSAVPTTPRQEYVLEYKEGSCTRVGIEFFGSCKQFSNAGTSEQLRPALPPPVPKVDHLCLTPVMHVRQGQVACKHHSSGDSSLYAHATSKSDSQPGPGQYFADSHAQLKIQDFRRPHNKATDGPFFLGENGESTRVRAMARSLKTPDSGLGPGLYEAASASFFRHAPQVVIGGYAPREAVTKPRSISYSRSIMAGHVSVDDGDAEGDAVNSNDHQAYHAHVEEWPQWASSSRTQDGAHSLTRPRSGRPSHHSRLPTPSSFFGQPRKPVTGVAGKSVAPVHCIPHQGCRDTWKQGCFQPPWTSMRRKPGVASGPPSDWGWVALSVDQGSFGKGAWAGDGRLEIHHQSMLTPDNTGPLLRSAAPAPNGMQRGQSSMHRTAPGCSSLSTTISSLQHHISSLSPTHILAETIQKSGCISSAALTDDAGHTAASDAALSHLCGAGSATADVGRNAETSHANSSHAFATASQARCKPVQRNIVQAEHRQDDCVRQSLTKHAVAAILALSLQKDFVDVEKALGREGGKISAITGYAGGAKGAGPGDKVCYYYGPKQAVYEELGHAEVVQMELRGETAQTRRQMEAFADTYFGQFRKTPFGMMRLDPQDAGPAYRNVIGIPKGIDSPLFEVLKERNKNGMDLIPSDEYTVDLKRALTSTRRIGPTGCPELRF
ncbi:hypothetical protein WJX79_004156 [Trebouxia sp. C0005]